MSEEIRRLLIEEIRKRLGPLEAAPADIEGALLAAVTLRGSAGLAGEPNLASALARLEPRLRAGEESAAQALISLLRRAATRLDEGESAAAGSWPVPPPDLEPTTIESFVRAPYEAEIKDRLAGIDQCLAAIDDPVEAVRVAFRHVHTLKGAASAVGDEPMSWFCHGLEERLRDVGDEASARAALVELGQYRGVLGGLAEDPHGTLRRLRGEVEVSARLSSRPAAMPATPPEAEPDDDTVRVEAAALGAVLEQVDALGALRESIETASRRARDIARRTRSATGTGSGAPSGDDLEALSADLRAQSDDLGGRLIRLKRQVAGLLLTNVGTVFSRLVAVIEAEARRTGRDVKTRIAGGDEPLDRRVAERLVEPCVQIARNAVAHGIEPPDVRRSIGKDPTGTISLSAKRTGSKLEIRIADDGAGVDLAHVRENALRSGMLPPDHAATTDDALLLSLLLRPGFSTQRSPDLLAGRGIGLDIAHHGIQKLGGTMRLVTRRGQGFTVRVEVPVEGPAIAIRLDAMSEGDLDAVAAISLESASSADVRDPGTRARAAVTRFREELGRPWARVRVARSGHDVAAYLVTWQVADEVHILDVATRRVAQRRGIARALMNELLAFARTLPVRHLLLEVRRSNAPAIHLYRSLGFFATNVRRRYYDDGEDAVEMRLVLDMTTREVCRMPDEIPLEAP